jgi:ATP-dependent DNA helicase RecG
MAESYGAGMAAMLKSYGGSLLKPRIEVSSNAFNVTLPSLSSGEDQLTPQREGGS